jgi:hypothetical protein
MLRLTGPRSSRFGQKYPDGLSVTPAGQTLQPGGRQHFSPHSPDYRRCAAAVAAALGGRYWAHPAVVSSDEGGAVMPPPPRSASLLLHMDFHTVTVDDHRD